MGEGYNTKDLYNGIIPFILIQIFVVGLLLFFPELLGLI